MFIVYIYVALASYNTGYLTLPLNSVECLVDETANVAIVDAEGSLIHEERPSWQVKSPDAKQTTGRKKKATGKGKQGVRSRQGSLSNAYFVGQGHELEWRNLWSEGTDAVMDIPIGGVCEILYGRPDMGHDVSGLAHDR